MLPIEHARRTAQSLVERASAAGADGADALYFGDSSTSVQVRLRALEQVDRSEGEQVGLRVFLGSKSATVATSHFAREALDELVGRALAMAAEAPDDPFAGLAPAGRLHHGPLPSLDCDDGEDPDPASLQTRALRAERSALEVAGVTNSNGASASASATVIALATSHGFSGAYRVSGHSCSASVVAGEGSAMQRDYAWHSARHLGDLERAEDIGRRAGERAAAKVKPVRVAPGPRAVLFDPRVSASLLGHFCGAISGSSVARGSSFLRDRLGERVFAQGVSIVDEPLRVRGLRSRPFDAEGLRVSHSELVEDGLLKQWIAESASARQLGIEPTGHASRGAGGAPGAAPSNLYFAPGKRSRAELLVAYPEALVVTELIGQGVNGVTGDYSRGAAGFLVRHGEIAEPVAEITIASNLIDMFATLEPGSDLEFRHGIDAPSLLVPEMTIGSA